MAGGCAFVQTGVIGDCNRDGFRHSRVLKGARPRRARPVRRMRRAPARVWQAQERQRCLQAPRLGSGRAARRTSSSHAMRCSRAPRQM